MADELREALEAVRFNLIHAGYETNSIMIEGIDKALRSSQSISDAGGDAGCARAVIEPWQEDAPAAAVTTPRDDIAGLINDIIDRRSHSAYPHHLDDLLDEAATQLDALSAERGRALRAEQERDEAYERAASLADCYADQCDATAISSNVPEQVAALRSKEQVANCIATTLRRLASGPDKEKE